MNRAMGRPALSAVAFALAAGAPTDARQAIHVDPVPGPGGRRLLASVEALEPSARGAEVAALALSALRAAFQAATDLPAEDALRRAFAAANAAVLAENRPLACGRWDRRVYVGAVALALAGRHLTIAQVPASQAIVVQDGQLYAFPDLASWRCDYAPDADRLMGTPEPDPLGFGDIVRPDIARTLAAPGDLILLCSTAIARGLARDGLGSGDPLLAGDLDTALERLARVAVTYELDDGHAAGIVLDRPLGRAALGAAIDPAGAIEPIADEPESTVAVRRAAPSRRRGAVVPTVPGVPWRRRALAAVGVPLDRDLPWDATDPVFDVAISPIGVPAPSRAPDRSDAASTIQPPLARAGTPPAPRSDAATSLPAGDDLRGPLHVTAAHLPPVLSDGAAIGPHVRRARTLARLQLNLVAFTEHLVPRHRDPIFALPARITLAAPGARSVRCYQQQRSLPVEWRTRLPRGPMVNIPGRVLSVVLILLLTFGTSGVAFGRYQDRRDRAEDLLAAASTHLATAVETTDAVAADDLLVQAADALRRAAKHGADEQDLAQRRLAVTTEQDRLRGVLRLVNLARVGTLPPAVAGRPVRLTRAGADVYVVGGALYRVDAAGHQLVELLAPGTTVGGVPVGELRDAAWNDDGVVATDGAALYAHGAAGWTRQRLNLIDGQIPWTAAACAAFQGGFYALDAEAGLVLKFAADQPEGLPEDWAGADDREALQGARDLAIDGHVHVLLANGHVRSFFRGTPRGDLAIEVLPPVINPVALYGGPGDNFLYVAEAVPTDPRLRDETAPVTGRVLRLDPNGGPTRQLLPPIAADPVAARAFATARDLVVDEAAGALYVLTGDAIWRATLPESATAA